MGNRHVIQYYVEVLLPLNQTLFYQVRHFFPLLDQFGLVKLLDNLFEHLVHNGGEDLLIKIIAQLPVNLRKFILIRPAQGSQRYVHHLQIPGAGQRVDGPGARPDVKKQGFLEPGEQDVRSFLVGPIGDPGNPVKLDLTETGVDVVQTVVLGIKLTLETLLTDLQRLLTGRDHREDLRWVYLRRHFRL